MIPFYKLEFPFFSWVQAAFELESVQAILHSHLDISVSLYTLPTYTYKNGTSNPLSSIQTTHQPIPEL